ncbi:MAG: Sua5/YciO/YrdC/YwlC family protein, partial [bacterium]|nr:Sua5/YciO/YrdC/YwlC family protein [bacterium]
VPERASGGGETIALRISEHPVVAAFIRAADLPLTGTSANISGEPSCRNAAEALAQFAAYKSLPDLVLDAGTLPAAPPVTVIDLTHGKPQLLRVGPVTKRDLEALWNQPEA